MDLIYIIAIILPILGYGIWDSQWTTGWGLDTSPILKSPWQRPYLDAIGIAGERRKKDASCSVPPT